MPRPKKGTQTPAQSAQSSRISEALDIGIESGALDPTLKDIWPHLKLSQKKLALIRYQYETLREACKVAGVGFTYIEQGKSKPPEKQPWVVKMVYARQPTLKCDITVAALWMADAAIRQMANIENINDIKSVSEMAKVLVQMQKLMETKTVTEEPKLDIGNLSVLHAATEDSEAV